MRYRIFVIFLFAYFLSYFFRSTNAVIADDLVRDLSLSPDQLGFMTGLFFGVFAFAQLAIGPALDRFGSRLTTAILLLFASLGSLLFASANSFAALSLGRALIGLGMAGVLMGSLKVFAQWFSLRHFATVSGVFVALGASGSLFATTPLEKLSNTMGWRGVFVWGAGLSLLAALIVWGFSRDHPKGYIAAKVQKGQGSLLTILREKAFWQIAFLGFTMVGSFFTYQSLWMGPYLSAVQGLGSATVSSGLLLLASASVSGYFVSGYLVDKLGLLRVVVVSSSAFFLLQLLLAFAPQGIALAYLYSLLLLFGFLGSFNIMLFSQVRQLFPEYLSGRALALTNMFGIGAVSIMQWLLGIVIGLFPLTARGSYAPEAFRMVFLVTAVLGLLSVLTYLPFLFRKTYHEKG